MEFAKLMADRFICIKLKQNANKGGNYERIIKRRISRFGSLEIWRWYNYDNFDFYIALLASREIIK